MKETQEMLLKMGFQNPNDNVWKSEWFGYFILLSTATPADLAEFIYNRGVSTGVHSKPIYSGPNPTLG